MTCKAICFLTVIMLFSASFAPAESLTVVHGDKTNPLVKVVQFIMVDIYQKLGYDVQFVSRPLKRALSEVNAGLYDAEVGRVGGLEDKYPDLIRVPVAIYAIEGVVFTKTKRFPVTDWESLKPYKVGVLRGVQFAEKGTENLDRRCADSLRALFGMLAMGRVDVVVEARLNGSIAFRQFKFHGSIKVLEPPLMRLELFHYVHEKNAWLVPKMAELLSRMKQDGTLDELIREAEQKVIEDVPVEAGFLEEDGVACESGE